MRARGARETTVHLCVCECTGRRLGLQRVGIVARRERDDPSKAEGIEYDGVQSVKVLLPTVVGERPALAGLPHLWSVHHLNLNDNSTYCNLYVYLQRDLRYAAVDELLQMISTLYTHALSACCASDGTRVNLASWVHHAA